MPRYRFSWDNVPSGILATLADAAGGDPSHAVDGLSERYGARPKENFVRELWTTLRDDWLAEDHVSRASVVDQLREAGLGSSVKDRTPDGEMAFLRGLRNAKTMRHIVLAAFHQLGEADGSKPQSSRNGKPAGGQVKISRGRKHVGFRQAAESPEGREFIGTLMSLVGELEVVPVGKIGETHVFVAPGNGRRALIAESHGTPTKDSWNSTIAFRTDDDEPLEATLRISRWDPALALGPDAVRNAKRAQRKEWDAERVERAATGDQVQYRQLDVAAEAPLASLTVAEVAAAWARIDELVPAPPPADARPASSAGDQPDDIRPLLLRTLRRETGDDTLELDADGEVGIRFGSTMVFVRAFGSPPIVRVYASVLSQVTASAIDVQSALAELNRMTALTKWLSVDGQVVAVVDLFGHPYDDAHVVQACHVVGSTGDDLDEQLQSRLGGKTFFGEHVSAPTPVSGPAGYI